ncbi:phosphodiesterase [Acetitomaculum ruminis]|nr:phosphodiesterase [Acetitomaculum ruminis]
MAASDIHGNAYYCEKLMDAFEKEGANKLLIAGDLAAYSSWGVSNNEGLFVHDILNQYAQDIICVSGNCDDPEEQVDYDFDMREILKVVSFEDKKIYLTHGHIYNPSNPPKMEKGSILLCGHSHIPAYEEYKDYIYLNPGSVSKPRRGSWHGYLLLTENEFIWKDLDGNIMHKIP